MALTKQQAELKTSFNSNLRRVRGHVAAARMFMEGGDFVSAYDEAEKAQHAAFDAKDSITRVLGNRLLTNASMMRKEQNNG